MIEAWCRLHTYCRISQKRSTECDTLFFNPGKKLLFQSSGSCMSNSIVKGASLMPSPLLLSLYKTRDFGKLIAHHHTNFAYYRSYLRMVLLAEVLSSLTILAHLLVQRLINYHFALPYMPTLLQTTFCLFQGCLWPREARVLGHP